MSPVSKILIYFHHFLHSFWTKITERKVGFRRNVDIYNPRSVHSGHSRRTNTYILELQCAIFSNFSVRYYYPVTCVLCYVWGVHCGDWRKPLSGLWCYMVMCMCTDVSKDLTASIIRIDELAILMTEAEGFCVLSVRGD